jgi:hypothetical protein
MRYTSHFISSAFFLGVRSTIAISSPNTELVVTNLKIVQGSTSIDAINQCEIGTNSKWSVHSINWLNSNQKYVHLCARRVMVQELKPFQTVVRRVGVFDGTSKCPPSMEQLYTPRSNVVVCIEYTLASNALHNKDFVANLMVTSERNYNNEVPGWTTHPVSIHVYLSEGSPSYKGAFLSVMRPVVPITDIELVKDVAIDDVYTACDTLQGASWQQAGFGYIDTGSKNSKTVMCVERSLEATKSMLVDIQVFSRDEPCDSPRISKRINMTKGWHLCTRYNISLSGIDAGIRSMIGDLSLHRTTQSSFDAEMIPGGWQGHSNDFNDAANDMYVFLFFRTTKNWNAPFPDPTSKRPLQAAQESNDSLRFKILQLADLHYTGDPTYKCRNPPAGMSKSNCTEALTTKFIGDLLDTENPDFVVFTGDNVETFYPQNRKLAMDTVTFGVEARGIPWAMVFGNHDDENGFRREEIYQIAASKELSYIQHGPAEVDGVGNYELNVKAPVDGSWGKQGSDVFRIYFLDSHGYPDRSKYSDVASSYDWVKQSQIEYYRKLSLSHPLGTNGRRLPAIMFFHIPLIEYSLFSDGAKSGELNEGVASSSVNTNLFSTLVELNEVKATFVGHDHVNEYCYKRQGINLCYGGGAGFGRAYGRENFSRRGRVIEWSINSENKCTIRSWKRHFDDLKKRKSEEILYQE